MERFLARSLIFMGILIALMGVALLLAPRIPLLGRLPGDLRFSRGQVTIVLPLATCLLASLLLTLLLNLFRNR